MTKSIEAIAGAHIGFTKLSIVIWITNTFGFSINQMTFAFMTVHILAGLRLDARNIFQAFVFLGVQVEPLRTQTLEC